MPFSKLILAFVLLMTFHSSFSQKKKLDVYVFVTEDCPVSIFMATSLKSIAETYANSRTNFHLIFPLSTSTEATAATFKTETKLKQFAIKIDKDQTLTKKLGATITPEVVITNGDTILYKGRINDAFTQPGKKKHYYTTNDLADALENIIAGREMPKPWKAAVGCFITIEN